MKLQRIWICALFLLVAASCQSQENLSDLIADARTLALDPSSNPVERFTDSQVTEFLNQGMRNLISQKHCIQQSMLFTLVPGTTYYPLPTNYQSVLRVTLGAKAIPQLSPVALDGRSRGWEVASGYPTYYFIDFSSRDLVGFAPWPQQSTDTDTVKIEYSVAATDMVNSTDLPFNGINELQPFDHDLAYYAAAIMSAIDNQSTMTSAYMKIYADASTVFNSVCTELPAYNPGAIGQP